MMLPDKIEIQIIDKSGRSNPLANIIFGLKIFADNDMWYNYSVFKASSDGQIKLTKQQLIDNTELKHDGYIESDVPTKFEIYAWDGQQTVDLIKSTKRLLELYNNNEVIRKDLLKHGFSEDNIPSAIEATREKSRDDIAFFEQIKDAINDNVRIYPSRVEGVWSDVSPKQYQFVIE